MTAWTDRAACTAFPSLPWDTDSDPTLGHLHRSGRRPSPVLSQQIRTMRSICIACPVRAECSGAADVEETGRSDTHGIRGGMTAPERHRARTEET